jgi:hypothetical protein
MGQGSMIDLLKELAQAALFVSIAFGPFFYYILTMKP